MHIAIDGVSLAEPRTGIGHYTFELARHLAELNPADTIEVVSHAPLDGSVRDDFASAREMLPGLRFIHAPAPRVARRWWWGIGLPLHLRESEADLFHGTNYELPLVDLPRAVRTTREKIRRVVTINDLSVLLHPGTHGSAATSRGARRLPLVARRAHRIITLTEAVRAEICEHLGVPPEKVTAVPLAARACFIPQESLAESDAVRRRFDISAEFVLSVGTIEPRKNLPRLVAAFERVLRETESRPQLVLVGRRGWLLDEWLAALRDSPVYKHLRLTGYVTDDELRALYSSCRAFVYPSLYEGFGLPPLEAMGCGAPVIASRAAAIAEVTGDAARLVEATDTDALARAMIDVLRDESMRRELAAAGLARARLFTWRRTAELTREVYDDALAAL